MNPVQLHTAGATVVHSSPFSTLEVPVDSEILAAELREIWVRPLYFGIQKVDAQDFLVKNFPLVSVELISKLLANFDWRPRSVAAYLVAVSGKAEFTALIGRLLLRSDVCYAGVAYCVALAALNSDESVGYLEEYLSYYLTQPNLWFDQAQAMAALSYLDRLNETERASRFQAEWEKFIANKIDWNLDESIVRFSQTMKNVENLKGRIALVAAT
ncbi:DUF6000 family protein [Pseudoduganella sp. R-43]|uniref:DUF6000 family protein n=1 Tax=unclassified Pseudoduganella TaxID=2637179 RepID=UPI003CF35DEF